MAKNLGRTGVSGAWISRKFGAPGVKSHRRKEFSIKSWDIASAWRLGLVTGAASFELG
jgi:hypothetical protein